MIKQGSRNNPRNNHEGYWDQTPYDAMNRQLKNRTYANRGRSFEELLDTQNDLYREQLRAMIKKQHTKFIPLRNAYGKVCDVKVEEKAIVDCMGKYKGRPVAFEAKYCSSTTPLELKRVEPHQAAWLDDWCQDPRSIGFVAVNYNFQHAFIIPWPAFRAAEDARARRLTGVMYEGLGGEWAITGKASIRADELPERWAVPIGGRGLFDYLGTVDKIWNL